MWHRRRGVCAAPRRTRGNVAAPTHLVPLPPSSRVSPRMRAPTGDEFRRSFEPQNQCGSTVGHANGAAGTVGDPDPGAGHLAVAALPAKLLGRFDHEEDTSHSRVVA